MGCTSRAHEDDASNARALRLADRDFVGAAICHHRCRARRHLWSIVSAHIPWSENLDFLFSTLLVLLSAVTERDRLAGRPAMLLAGTGGPNAAIGKEKRDAVIVSRDCC